MPGCFVIAELIVCSLAWPDFTAIFQRCWLRFAAFADQPTDMTRIVVARVLIDDRNRSRKDQASAFLAAAAVPMVATKIWSPSPALQEGHRGNVGNHALAC